MSSKTKIQLERKIKLVNGDCLELMKSIPDKSVDMCLTDPPYGTTACKWDTVIPFEPMWEQLHRIVKDNGAICLFGQNPFTANLVMSNVANFRYDVIWEKDQAKNFFFLKKQIGKVHEIVSIFYRKQPTYNPQMRAGFCPQQTGATGFIETHKLQKKKKATRHGKTDRYPISIIKETSLKKSVHPTQKPIPLCEFFISSFTNEGETVLDFTMGSGSTGVACKNLNRNFIGIEKDQKYFQIAKERIGEC